MGSVRLHLGPRCAPVDSARRVLDETIESVAVREYERLAPAVDRVWTDEVASIRRAISTQIEQVLADGVRDGSFAVPDLPGTTLAVLSLSIDVARWYTPHRGEPEALGKLYADLAHRMVQA